MTEGILAVETHHEGTDGIFRMAKAIIGASLNFLNKGLIGFNFPIFFGIAIDRS
jgi:hypothetical protein